MVVVVAACGLDYATGELFGFLSRNRAHLDVIDNIKRPLL